MKRRVMENLPGKKRKMNRILNRINIYGFCSEERGGE